MNIALTTFGRYEHIDIPEDFDIVFGHSFGTSVEPGSVNHRTALAVTEFARDDSPIAVDRALANAFTKNMRQPDYVVEGASSNIVGRGIGAWGTLIDARDNYMSPNGLESALQIAQVNFIGRVLMQAQKAEIPSVAPAPNYLPKGFDRKSGQPWTRSMAHWIPREIIGSVVLRTQGKL